MIRYFLIPILLLIFAYAVSQRKHSRVVAIIIASCSVLGVFLVVSPTITTLIANALGVGRGVDLITYIMSVVFLASIFNLHLKIKKQAEIQTELARSIALLSVNCRRVEKDLQ